MRSTHYSKICESKNFLQLPCTDIICLASIVLILRLTALLMLPIIRTPVEIFAACKRANSCHFLFKRALLQLMQAVIKFFSQLIEPPLL